MAITREHRAIPRPTDGAMEASLARPRTSSALGTSSACGARATPLPRSTRVGGTLVLLAGLLAGCQPYVQGNGVYLEERRSNVASFAGLHVESGVEVTVTAGAAVQSVTVSGDANVVPFIETQVQTDGGRQVLHVWISTAFGGTIPPRAVVEVPSFEYVLATEASRVNAKKVAATSFVVVADQGSNVVLEGAAAPAGESMDVKLSTRALLDATAYAVSRTASVDLTSASIARLHSDGPVTGTVTGGSQLDNLHGTGSCSAVVVDGTSTVRCPP